SADALSAGGRARRTLRELGGWLHDVYEAGVVAEKRNGQVLGYSSISLREGESEAPRPAGLLSDRREALARIDERARESFSGDPRGVRLTAELAAPYVQPNVAYDRAETDWRRVQARAAVPATVGAVQKDEMIVDANQRVTRET